MRIRPEFVEDVVIPVFAVGVLLLLAIGWFP